MYCLSNTVFNDSSYRDDPEKNEKKAEKNKWKEEGKATRKNLILYCAGLTSRSYRFAALMATIWFFRNFSRKRDGREREEMGPA